MITKNETYSLSNSLFTILKVENCFIKTEFHSRYGNQLFRNMHQFNNLNRILQIAEHHMDEYIQWNNETIPEMKINNYDLFIELLTLLCNHGLATYEILKRFFLETIDLESLNNKTKSRVKKHSTLGTLVDAICELPNVNEKIKNELFDIGFRNALGHDTWYLEKNLFCYVEPKSNQKITLSLQQAHQRIECIFIFYWAISQNYTKLFFPEVIKEYDEEFKQIMDEVFPIYIANPRETD